MTCYPERGRADALAAQLNAEDDGSVRYAVCENQLGFYVEVLDAETGERLITL